MSDAQTPEKWTIDCQTIDDLATGLRFAFTAHGGRPCLTVTRFDRGLPVGSRDIVFNKDGKECGAGSLIEPPDGCMPVNPPGAEHDAADWWKDKEIP